VDAEVLMDAVRNAVGNAGAEPLPSATGG